MSKNVPLETVHEIHNSCLCLATQRAARRLARRFDRAFQPVGLTNGQFSLMMALHGSRAPKLAALAAFLAMDRTTLTAALKALERRGLVRVAADPVDRRARLLALTEAGRAALAAAVPIWRAEHGALAAELDNIGALCGALRNLAPAQAPFGLEQGAGS